MRISQPIKSRAAVAWAFVVSLSMCIGVCSGFDRYLRCCILHAQGMALAKHNEYAAAERLWRYALTLYPNDASQDEAYATIADSVGVLLKRQSKYAEAEVLFKRALQIRRRMLGEDCEPIAVSLRLLAHV